MSASVPTIPLSIQDTTGTVFAGEALAVSSENEAGTFDIMPEHTNFITVIKTKLVIYHTSGKKQELSIQSGILYCLASKVEVYLGVAAE